MTRSSVLGGATRVDPDPDDRQSATDFSVAIAGATRLVLCFPNGAELELPPQLLKILQASADELSAGHAVTVVASELLLTPAEVGNLLGLSRPYVARLLDQGQIPSEYLPDSRHRVVRLTDVVEFQAQRERRREGRQRILDTIESDDYPY